MGFKQGLSSPCLFRHEGKEISTFVHGDYFFSVGPEATLIWMKNQLESRFILKSWIMGEGEHFAKQLKFLNRRIGWHAKGISYEADTKHVANMLKSLNLEHVSPLGAPGAKIEKKGSDMENEVEMMGGAATHYRANVATSNYLAIDRPDIQYSTKECSRRMARPVESDWVALKHQLRYLKGNPRAVQWFRWKRTKSPTLKGYSDSDRAGCRRTRKSTSEGCILFNGRLLKSWSKNQNVIATSSGEAELYAAVKCAAELLGLKSIAKDLGIETDVELSVDANATIGMLCRSGLGKLRHIEVSELWLQEAVKLKRVLLKKVPGTDNPADLMTKNLGQQDIKHHMCSLGIEFCLH